MTQTEVVAIIPARGGSKSIPRKNIKDLGGFPLISYSIAVARAADLVTRVIVSTDDEEIATVARRYGAETPYLRPAEFSQDQTQDLPVYEHGLQWLDENEDYRPDIVVQLRPTSPFRKTWQVDRSVELLIGRPDCDSVRAVIPPYETPFKMWTIGSDGLMQPLMKDSGFEEPYNMPRQSLPDTYWQTGYVDTFWADTILTKKSMTGDRILPLVTPQEDWIDLDSPLDWIRAERLLADGTITFDDLGYQITEVE